MNMSTVRALLMTVMLLVPVFSIGMVNAGTAGAWLALGQHTQYPSEGGQWNYGFYDIRIRSEYSHPSLCHGSTVVYDGQTVRSINTAAGYFSNASTGGYNHRLAEDAYYYRIC